MALRVQGAVPRTISKFRIVRGTHPTNEVKTSTRSTKQSFVTKLRLVLLIARDGPMVTADLKFYESLKTGPYASKLLWVEDIPQSKE